MTEWIMPPEWAEQERIWIAFPRDNYTIGDEPESRDRAYATWSAVANAIVDFEPVTAVVDPSALAEARKRLDPRIEILESPLDDSWMRDIGPTFVLNAAGKLGGVDWTFNGWGANNWAMWERDREIAKFVSDSVSAEHIPSALVNEGGGIHVDGEGTVLLTETVQLDPMRNPYTTKERVEWEMARTIGAKKAIWLPRGCTVTMAHREPVVTLTWSPALPSLEWFCCTGKKTQTTPTPPNPPAAPPPHSPLIGTFR